MEAAWSPGARPSHLTLALKISHGYKILVTGRIHAVPGGGVRPLTTENAQTHNAGAFRLIRYHMNCGVAPNVSQQAAATTAAQLRR